VEKALGRKAEESDLNHIRDIYVNKLRREAASNPHNFEAVAGARELIASLLMKKGFAVALATGCWRDTALLKLEITDIPYKGLPLASADDSNERSIIMVRALERALVKARLDSFQSITYVGDGVWDAVASKKLGYYFIGIGAGTAAEKLRKHGTIRILEDLSDQDCFYQLVEFKSKQ
jgi:phosphoglycolate phosphatase-like HAD superfamily hydrolase